MRRLTELETKLTELETIDLVSMTLEHIRNLTVDYTAGHIMLKDAVENDYDGTLRKVLEKYCGGPHLVNAYFPNTTEECRMSFADSIVQRSLSIKGHMEDSSFFSFDY